jgi:hypothetical protein
MLLLLLMLMLMLMLMLTRYLLQASSTRRRISDVLPMWSPSSIG